MTSITVPGSKSYSNRALLLAALCQGESHLENVLISDDTRVMIEALTHLSIDIQQDGNTLIVTSNGHFTPPKKPLYLGNAGTAVRFLTAVLAHQPFVSEINGNAQMHERPIQDLLDALSALGVKIEAQNGCPPLKIHGGTINHNKTYIPGKNSSQYISALMMLGPLLKKGLTIQVDGEATSKPYLDMTLDLMNKFCIQDIERDDHKRFTIPHQTYCPTDLTIEADASAATYFFGLAAITGKTITLKHISSETLQPDIKILNHLEAMGCDIQEKKEGITIIGPDELAPLGIVNANDFPDGAMTLAVVCAFSDGKTTLTGLHNLRLKECDRLAALTAELTKIGCKATKTDNSLTIIGTPNEYHDATIETYNDHRIAMCFGMASALIPDLKVKNPSCVNKTYPQFWNDLKTALQ